MLHFPLVDPFGFLQHFDSWINSIISLTSSFTALQSMWCLSIFLGREHMNGWIFISAFHPWPVRATLPIHHLKHGLEACWYHNVPSCEVDGLLLAYFISCFVLCDVVCDDWDDNSKLPNRIKERQQGWKSKEWDAVWWSEFWMQW